MLGDKYAVQLLSFHYARVRAYSDNMYNMYISSVAVRPYVVEDTWIDLQPKTICTKPISSLRHTCVGWLSVTKGLETPDFSISRHWEGLERAFIG